MQSVPDVALLTLYFKRMMAAFGTDEIDIPHWQKDLLKFWCVGQYGETLTAVAKQAGRK
jgi:hypothetical protein